MTLTPFYDVFIIPQIEASVIGINHCLPKPFWRMYFYHPGKNTGSFSHSLEMVCDLRGSKELCIFHA